MTGSLLITLKKKKKKLDSNSEIWKLGENEKEVGCITVDYAMQNVLLHMGLNLISTGGLRIRKITRWVKRCYACRTVVSQNGRVYCPNCGNHTLLRVQCVLDEDGKVKFFFNDKKKINLRGTIFNIKRSKGGQKSNDVILREDATYGFKMKGSKHNKYGKLLRKGVNPKDPFSDEFNFDTNFRKSKVKNTVNVRKAMKFYNGYGRKNPNVATKGKKRK